jgi:NAD(P)-dependent dehydrogenase (short-subunit alcohol dehydrogenase family)
MAGTQTGALAGKAALVTAGAAGISWASARLLALDGAAITFTGRTVSALEDAKARLEDAVPSARVTLVPGDGNKDEDVRAAVAATVKDYGRIDMVLATVGDTVPGPLAELSADDFMKGVSLSLRPAFLAMRESIPHMPNGGTFVFISSTAAEMPFINLGAYCVGKAGIDHMARCAANELGHKGFRFNVIRPGVIRTAATKFIFGTKAIYDGFIERVPMGHLGEPDDIAYAVRYLLGPESRFTTGQSIAVDGGNELRGAPMPV